MATYEYNYPDLLSNIKQTDRIVKKSTRWTEGENAYYIYCNGSDPIYILSYISSTLCYTLIASREPFTIYKKYGKDYDLSGNSSIIEQANAVTISNGITIYKYTHTSSEIVTEPESFNLPSGNFNTNNIANDFYHYLANNTIGSNKISIPVQWRGLEASFDITVLS